MKDPEIFYFEKIFFLKDQKNNSSLHIVWSHYKPHFIFRHSFAWLSMLTY